MNMMKTEKITGKMTAYKICLIAFAICISYFFRCVITKHTHNTVQRLLLVVARNFYLFVNHLVAHRSGTLGLFCFDGPNTCLFVIGKAFELFKRHPSITNAGCIGEGDFLVLPNDLQSRNAGCFGKVAFEIFQPLCNLCVRKKLRCVTPNRIITHFRAIVSITICLGGVTAFEVLIAEFFLFDCQTCLCHTVLPKPSLGDYVYLMQRLKRFAHCARVFKKILILSN